MPGQAFYHLHLRFFHLDSVLDRPIYPKSCRKVDAWDGAVAKQHEHTNKTVLDGISAEKVADWDSKAAGNHEHDITELKQASGYIVFNCGSASVNI